MSSGSCLAICTLAGCVPFLYHYNLVRRKETLTLTKLTAQKVNQESAGTMQKLADLRAWEVLGISF